MIDTDLQSGGMVGRRYAVEKALGRGVLGHVWLGRDLSNPDMQVALKVFAPMPERDAAGIGRDIADLMRLRHPSLARVLDFGTLDDGKTPFIVEEYVAGQDVLSAMEGRTAVDIVRAVVEICRGLQYLHASGITHRSLKPSNVFVCGAERDIVKLLDYGLLPPGAVPRRCDASRGLSYVAPEVVMGHPWNPRTDLYALGVLAYELFVHRLPFDDEDQGYLLQKHLQGKVDIRLFERLPAGVALAQIIRTLLDKNPEKRPSSAEEVVRLLSVATGTDYAESFPAAAEHYFCRGPFVGRDREMELLQARASRVKETGRGWTVFIAGESGAGKSRLMEEFRTWGLLSGWKVVEGSCFPAEEKTYAPFRQVLAATDRLEPATSVSARKEVIFRFDDPPKVGVPGKFDTPSDSAAGQFRDMLTRELVRRLADRPTILLLHDFHWSDEGTTAVLDYFTSDIASQPVMTCVSLRGASESPGPVARLVDRCLRQCRAESIVLEPLSGEDAESLAAGLTGSATVARQLGSWLHRAGGGNPFFLEEILKHLVDRGLLRRDLGKWQVNPDVTLVLEVPDRVALLIGERLRLLSAPATHVARWMAVFQRSVSREMLCLASGIRTAELDEGLSELLSRQLVWRAGSNGEDHVEFRHALVADMVRESIKTRELRRMHLRIAEALEQRFGTETRVQELAQHYTECRGGQKAIDYALRAAAIYRSEFANEPALRFFEYVLRQPGNLTPDELCEVAISAADACCALGTPKRAIRFLAPRMRPNLSNPVRARVLAQLAQAYQHSGDVDAMVEAAKGGLTSMGRDSAPETKALLFLFLAYAALAESRPSGGISLLKRALKLAQNDPTITGRTHSIMSALFRIRCKLREAVAASQEAIAHLNRANTIHYLPVAHSHLGAYLNALGRFSKALPEHDKAVAISSRTRSVFHQAQALSNLAECLCRSGDLRQAILVSAEASRLAESTGNRAWIDTCRGSAIETHIFMGSYRKAYLMLRELSCNQGSSLPVYVRAQAHYLFACLFFHLNDFDAASRHLSALGRISTTEAPPFERELGQILQARILLNRNEIAKAISLLRRVQSILMVKHWPYQLCQCKIVFAEALLLNGDLIQASRQVRWALKLARAMPSRQLEAEAAALLGKIILESSDGRGNQLSERIDSLRRAREYFQSAADAATECGARELRFKAHYQLAQTCEALRDFPQAQVHAQEAVNELTALYADVPDTHLRPFRAESQRQIATLHCSRILSSSVSSTGAEDISSLEDQHIRTLYRISRMLSNTRELKALLDGIAQEAVESMKSDRCFIVLKQEGKQDLALAKRWELHPQGEAVSSSLIVADQIIRQVYETAKPLVSIETLSDERFILESGGLARSCSAFFCGPLSVYGECIGTLYLDRNSPLEYLDQSHISMFAALCNISAVAIQNAILHDQLVNENVELHRVVSAVTDRYPEILGTTEIMTELKQKMALVAASRLDILVWGESGTGKELVARALHRTGRRAEGPFVAVDCGALSESIVEGELFGFRKGSFTGAIESRPGLIELAHKGALFLDEVSNMSFPVQAKLLRVLQEREVRRVGESTSRRIDVQVIAATNRNLGEEVSGGRFREDLFHRLCGIELRVPALRERIGDVRLLAKAFLDGITACEHGKPRRLSADALGALLQYRFPGNIRELKNIIEGVYYTCTTNVIGRESLPSKVFGFEVHGGPNPTAKTLLDTLKQGKGDFDTVVKRPFLQRQFSVEVLRAVIEAALRQNSGRYRDAFGMMRVRSDQYSTTIQFLKRHKCYLNFRAFRPGKP